MDAEELFVHDGGEGEAAKGFQAGVVDAFRVFVFA